MYRTGYGTGTGQGQGWDRDGTGMGLGQDWDGRTGRDGELDNRNIIYIYQLSK